MQGSGEVSRSEVIFGVVVGLNGHSPAIGRVVIVRVAVLYQVDNPKFHSRAQVFRQLLDTGGLLAPLPQSRENVLHNFLGGLAYRSAFFIIRQHATNVGWQPIGEAVEPGRVKTRLDLHRVSLASGADLWYQGSGATSSTGRFFGFAGRAAAGATALGTVLEGTIEVPIKKYWSLNASAATIRGGAVVRRMFAGTTLTTGYVENVIRF